MPTDISPNGEGYWPGSGHEAAADIADRVCGAIALSARSPFADAERTRLDPDKAKTLRSLVLDTLVQAVQDGAVTSIVGVEIGVGQDAGQVVVLVSVWMRPPNDQTLAEIAIPMIFP